MKFFITFILLIIFNFSFGQNHRFVYEYKFTNDSTKIDSLKSELMNLDVFDKYSFFYGQTKFTGDSINTNSILEQQKRTPGSISISSYGKEWNTSYIVKKNYPDYKTVWETAIGNESLAVEESRKPNWKISNEIETIEKHSCQKATVDFGGRKWTAWFTRDIPIPEGPYKFYGLPGLIVKLEDQSKTHQFLLKGNQKITEKNKSWNYIQDLRRQAYGSSTKQLQVNEKQYKKLYQEYKNDPVKSIRQELSMPGYSVVIQTADGKQIKDNAEVIRYYENEAKERMKKFNNPIEFY